MEVAQCLPHNYSVVRKLEDEIKELRSRLALDELLEERQEMEAAFSHWVVIERDKLRIENAKLETEIKSLKDSLNRFIQCPQCGNKTVFTYMGLPIWRRVNE